MNKFSNTSTIRLSTCHEDLRLIFNVSIGTSQVDFGVAEGHRSLDLQKKYFDEGKSDIDGINTLGKHNYSPSMAVDIYGWVNGRETYDERTLCYLAGHIMGVAIMLRKEGKITHALRWGGNWDRDGEIITDQKLRDLVHFELETL